jgi:hypothetical protein
MSKNPLTLSLELERWDRKRRAIDAIRLPGTPQKPNQPKTVESVAPERSVFQCRPDFKARMWKDFLEME